MELVSGGCPCTCAADPAPRALPWAASGLPNSWAEGTPWAGYHARCRKVHVEGVLQAQV